MRELDLRLADGRVVHAYDTGADGGSERLTVIWHHGTPNIGAPPEPLFPVSARLDVRWVGYDRPGYGGSTRREGRDIASTAADVVAVADTLGIDRFAVMGHSGGGSHGLATAALLPDRVVAAISIAGLAPPDAEGLDWFGGMAPASEASLRAALRGREAKERHEAMAGPHDDIGFIAADFEALRDEWSWFGPIVDAGLARGPGGLMDDDLAYVAPWGFELEQVTAPTLILHGGRDRAVPSAHGAWLARHLPSAELWLKPDDGHISVLAHAPATLEWLASRLRSADRSVPTRHRTNPLTPSGS